MRTAHGVCVSVVPFSPGHVAVHRPKQLKRLNQQKLCKYSVGRVDERTHETKKKKKNAQTVFGWILCLPIACANACPLLMIFMSPPDTRPFTALFVGDHLSRSHTLERQHIFIVALVLPTLSRI